MLRKEVLILCIEKPGESGQAFLDTSNGLIKKINNLKIRNKFNLCVDGGLSQKNINKIECEKIVSASNVFKNKNPKKQYHSNCFVIVFFLVPPSVSVRLINLDWSMLLKSGLKSITLPLNYSR